MEGRVENPDMRALSLSLKSRRLVPLRDAAREIVAALVRKHKGNVRAMAEELGVDRKALATAIMSDPELERLRASVFAGKGKPPAVTVTEADLRRHGGNVKAMAAELGVSHGRLTRAIGEQPVLAALQRKLSEERPGKGRRPGIVKASARAKVQP